jgi:hypothetical protein
MVRLAAAPNAGSRVRLSGAGPACYPCGDRWVDFVGAVYFVAARADEILQAWGVRRRLVP